MNLKSTTKTRTFIISATIAVSAAALAAKMYGPFDVAAAGPAYLRTDLATDAVNEYQAAQTLANLYLQRLFQQPLATVAAVKNHDFIRVVYFDGQIADFEIALPYTDLPVRFIGTVPTKTTRRLSQAQLDDIDRRNNTCASLSTSTVSYNTGYWGQQDESDGSTVTVTAQYIDTGTITISYNNSVRCQYR